jgi:hypothetical protein
MPYDRDRSMTDTEAPLGLGALTTPLVADARVIVWGRHRDSAELREIGWPVFSTGALRGRPARAGAARRRSVRGPARRRRLLRACVSEPGLSFRDHLRRIGGTIEE